MRTFILIFGPLWVISCAQSKSPATPDDTSPDTLSQGVARLEVASLDFGEVSVTTEGTRTLSLSLENSGTGDLLLEAVSTADPDLFSVAAPLRAIAPGEIVDIAVTFTPTADVSAASTLTFRTSDPDAPAQEVALLGEGLAPHLALSAETLDFGLQAQGCATVLPLTLTNTGREQIVVQGFALSTTTDELEVVTHPIDPFPLTLAPGQADTLDAAYSPTDDLSDTVLLSLSTDSPLQPEVQVTLEGEGLSAASHIDTATCDQDTTADILFAVDKSSSMSAYFPSLYDSVGAFFEPLQAEDVDYRVAFIVQDSGQVYGSAPYIDSSTSDAEGVAQEMLSGPYGGSTEMAFTLFEYALGSGSGRPGSWLREDTSLHLIGISDDAEQSARRTWSEYVALFQTLPVRDLTMHAIGGDYPSGCNGSSPYSGMFEAVASTGGLFLSICQSDWEDGMVSLADQIVAQAAVAYIPLQAQPVLDSIRVYRDGVEVTSGWEYDASTQRIVFDADHDTCASLEVSYTVQNTCL